MASPPAHAACGHASVLGCARATAIGLSRGYAVGVVGSWLLDCLVPLAKGKLGPSRAVAKFAARATQRTGLFLALYAAVFRAALCALRSARGRHAGVDGLNQGVAGCVAGLAAVVEDRKRRSALALYLFTRSFYLYLRSLGRRGLVPSLGAGGDVLLNGLASSAIIHSFLRHADVLESDYLRFLVHQGAIPKPMLYVVAATIDGRKAPIDNATARGFLRESALVRTEVAAGGGDPDDDGALASTFHAMDRGKALCVLAHNGDSSCAVGMSRFGVHAIRRALGLYIPFYLVATGIFRTRSLISRPLDTLRHLVASVLRSTAFLSSYTTISWAIPCALRSLLGETHEIFYWLNGFAAGCMAVWEHTGRRSELALYLLPKALSALYNQAVAARTIPRLRNGEVGLFAAGSAVLAYLHRQYPDDVGGNIRSVLVRVLGDPEE